MASNIKLFPPQSNKIQGLFKWEDVKTWILRMHYNELLGEVLARDEKHKGNAPYYNSNYCLSLKGCQATKDFWTKFKATATAKDGFIPPETWGRIQKVYGEDIFQCLDKASIDSVGKSLFLPVFSYNRILPAGNPIKIPGASSDTLDLSLSLNGLTIGAVLWLYNYEQMGIFQTLNALLDDYNYIGKYPVSGKLVPPASDKGLDYPPLMEMLSNLYRMGLGSTKLERTALYTRVLGKGPDQGARIDPVSNTGFKTAFDDFNKASTDYYRSKQLAQAIQGTATTADSIRSSVATQTTIRDTIQVMQKNFEVFEYGRNRLTTFLGIATVYAAICLIRMLKDEIGVPRQYDDPSEFIPAAYDILVLKRPASSSALNRFTIYDNCASYGYRLLTDIEMADPAQLTTISLGSTLDLWLNDIEGVVEGYSNALRQAQMLEMEKNQPV